jgi:hypothetical protein
MNVTDQADAVAAPPEMDIVERVAGGDGPLSARDAANSLVDARHKQGARERRDQENEDAQARDDAAGAPQGSSPGDAPGNGAGPETVPGETQGDDRAEAPSIEPPRSWTKEDKELFKGLPRATQERLVARERSRESDFLRRQNEAAEKRRRTHASRRSGASSKPPATCAPPPRS